MLNWILGTPDAVLREPAAFFVGIMLGALVGYLIGASTRSLSA